MEGENVGHEVFSKGQNHVKSRGIQFIYTHISVTFM